MKKICIAAAMLGILVGGALFFFKKERVIGIRTNLLGYPVDATLDPAQLRFVQEYFVLDNVTVKLIGIGSSHEYVNDLAKTLTFSTDKRTIDVVLKEAYFSDGSRITAGDVAASLKRTVILGSPHTNIKNLWIGSENLKSINDEIEGIRVAGPDRIVLKLTRATKELLFFLSLTDMAVLHKSQYTKDKLLVRDWMSVTSGAYHVGYNRENKLVLIANDKTLNYGSNMPKTVTFESYKGDDVIKRLKDQSLDFGTISFKDYIENISTIEQIKGFDVVGDKADGVAYVGLNTKSKIFSKKENRQWVQKKIIEAFFVDEKYSKVSSKAYQFFLPDAKGHIPKAKVENLLPHVDTSKIPDDLKNGIRVRSIEGMKYYVPPNLAESLSSALGIKVEIDLSVPTAEFMTFMKERDFDATMMGFGMSYKVLGEALNLQYLSENPFLLDPSGNIKSLLTKYQKEENDGREQELISQILEQMVVDAECVPLYYFAAPFFVKRDKLEASDLNLDESVKFYKAVMR